MFPRDVFITCSDRRRWKNKGRCFCSLAEDHLSWSQIQSVGYFMIYQILTMSIGYTNAMLNEYIYMLNEIARSPFPGNVNRAVCACTGHPKIHSPKLLGRVEQVKMIHSALFFFQSHLPSLGQTEASLEMYSPGSLYCWQSGFFACTNTR